MLFSLAASVFMIIGITLLLGLTPEQITDDIMALITPHDSMREEAKNIRGNRNKHRLYYTLLKFKTALAGTGKTKQFSFVCFASVVLFAVGIIVSVMIDNLFLMPVLATVFALLPFLYSSRMIAAFDKRTKEELETTLSAITNSYIRTDDILRAVKENLEYIKPPLNEVFRAFEGDATAISANTRTALIRLKEKVNDEIFSEWCDTVILCQDDRTLKDALQPIVEKLSDVRVVNNELKTMLSAAKNEYWMMAALVIGNIPLLYLLNKDWFHTLMFTVQGKAILGICGAVILITSVFMFKFTRPISYRR